MAGNYIMLEDNDVMVQITGLQDSSDDTYLNAATVTALLLDSAGTTVTGQSMPISMGYVGGSNGNYQGIFDTLVALDHGDTGTIEITAIEGTLNAFWTLPYTCLSRQA